jgi:NADH-quinone oxidoreductase subunit M
MVNHGLVVAPLFFIILLLSRRAGGSEDVREMGGIAFRAPVLAGLFLIVALATLAIPGSSNFVGEFLILLGAFKAKLVIAIIAFSGVGMASVYALRLFIGAMHNRVGPKVKSRDITPLDGLVLVPLVAVILMLALYPQLALHRSEHSVKVAVGKAHFYTEVDKVLGKDSASETKCPSLGVQRFEGIHCEETPTKTAQGYGGSQTIWVEGK